jgi:hypothetical protein
MEMASAPVAAAVLVQVAVSVGDFIQDALEEVCALGPGTSPNY